MAKKCKVHSLTGRITLPLVHAAWKAVKRNRGAAGIDKVSVNMFAANLDENLQALMRDLKNGSFEPKPLRRVYIPKDAKKTKFRPLGIPAVRDRVAQEVIRRLLSRSSSRCFTTIPSVFVPGDAAIRQSSGCCRIISKETASPWTQTSPAFSTTCRTESS